MASPAGARAEVALRRRHRDAWPRSLYAYDLDEVRRQTGRTILTESPRGLMALTAEYKAVEEGPLDLDELQFQIAADVTRPDLPAFVVQVTHPDLVPAQPWAFRLWPVNAAARPFGPVELTEVDYVRLAYLLVGGVAGAGGDVITGRGEYGHTWVENRLPPWSELAHLDDRFPDPDVWPDVNPARPRSFTRIAQPPRFVVERFLGEHGRLLGGTPEPVPVLRLPPRRLDPVAPGPVSAVRRFLAGRGATRAVPVRFRDADAVAVQLALDLAPAQPSPLVVVAAVPDPAAARLAQVNAELSDLRRRYLSGGPSDDNRDQWRAYDRDGARRWHR